MSKMLGGIGKGSAVIPEDPAQPIITVGEARKLLGLRFRHFTDAEVQELIEQVDFLVALSIKHLKKLEKG